MTGKKKSIVEKRVIDWRAIRKLVDNHYISGVFVWLVILPVSAKLASKLPDEITLPPNLFGENIIVELTLPFTWYVLYIAAVFFSISRLLYLRFCPPFIQAYKNAGEAIAKGVTIQMYTSDLGEEIVTHIGERGTLSEKEESSIGRFLHQLGLSQPSDYSFLNRGVSKQEFSKEFPVSLARVDFRESAEKPGYYFFTNRTTNLTIHRDQLQKHLWWDLDRILKKTHVKARVVCAFFAFLGYAFLFVIFLQSAYWVIWSL